MRRKKLFIAAMLLAIPSMVLCKQSEQVRAQSKKGVAAVWIENEKGEVVKTLPAERQLRILTFKLS